MNVEATVEITEKDLYRLQTDTLRMRGSLPLFMTLPLMGVAYVAAYAGATDGSDMMLFIGIFCAVLPLLMVWGMRRSAKKIKKENASFRQPIRYRVSEELLHVEAYQGASDIRWADAWDAVEYKTAYYVFLSSVQAMILPKRYFTPEEQAQISQLLKTVFPVRKKQGRRVVFIALACLLVLASVAMLAITLMI
ncbi:MAG: YcxB family protein [Rikenellaceae bacterium]|jgi:hypothetical protein|nr:YcxB family protein [Rikenellaceae bacterium]